MYLGNIVLVVDAAMLTEDNGVNKVQNLRF